jgi:hypothetical protein
MKTSSYFCLISFFANYFCRDCIGDCVLAGDVRWAGTFGVNLDFVARSHCSVDFVATDDIKVKFISDASVYYFVLHA